ncbi:MAG: hypothetical protein EA428_15215 [Spirochaetaceae bacterium]|nr:MAG: hypothetical protein EA428_15215 [Spirochaetaceae bacterium]
MKFHDFYIAMGDLRLFDLATAVERTGGQTPDRQSALAKELYRWQRLGRVRHWRRELYSIAEEYGGPRLHPLELGAQVQPPAYISLTTALEWHGALEPRGALWTESRDSTPTSAAAARAAGDSLGAKLAADLIATLDPPGTVVAVGTRHGMSFQNELGRFRYRQIHPRLFWGFSQEVVASYVLIADAEAEVADPDAASWTSVVEVPIALPHKALIDLWYLTHGRWTPQVYEALQLNTSVIDRHSLEAFAQRYGLTPRVRVAYTNFENYAEAR